MLQEHLKWTKVHVVGHSMGGMVATRLAALAPERVASLTLISTTAGGTQAIPRSWRAVKYAMQVRPAATCHRVSAVAQSATSCTHPAAGFLHFFYLTDCSVRHTSFLWFLIEISLILSGICPQLANAQSAEDRAKVDLKLHFMKATLDEPVRHLTMADWCTHMQFFCTKDLNRRQCSAE